MTDDNMLTQTVIFVFLVISNITALAPRQSI